MPTFRYNTETDGIDELANINDSVSIATDEKMLRNLFKSQSKKRRSFVDLCDDDGGEESEASDVLDLLEDLPSEISNSKASPKKKQVVDLTLDNGQFIPDECLSTRTPININHPLKEMMGSMKGCDINTVIKEIKEYKSGFLVSASEELRIERDPQASLPEPKKRKIYPLHTDNEEYRDFSHVTDRELQEEMRFMRTKSGQPQEPFPVKLHKILEQSEIDGYSSIISWLAHGRAFKIHNKYEFIEQIMPKYFYQSKLTSFQRQLKIYGFYKLQHGLDKGAYCHELFLRSRPGLCAGITRELSRRTIMLNKEPDFYEMTTLSPDRTALSTAAKNEPRPIVYVPKGNGVGSNASKPIDLEKTRPTPIKLIRNGKLLTKEDIKSGGLRITTNLSGKPDLSSVTSQVSFVVARGFPINF